jgi:excreted virulence factor EspC (type VII ESX diderm)
MSSGGFHVSTEELKAHAESVGRVAESVDEAATAAGTERAGGLVYGVLFDATALPFLNMWADHIQSLIHTAGETGQAIAKGVKTNADTYDGVEKANSSHITKSGGR